MAYSTESVAGINAARIPALDEDDWALVSDFAYLMLGNRRDATTAIEYATIHAFGSRPKDQDDLLRGIVQAAVITKPKRVRVPALGDSDDRGPHCELIAECLGHVDAMDRAVLVLHDVLSLRLERAAATLGMPPAQIKDRLFAGRVDLMNHLAPTGP